MKRSRGQYSGICIFLSHEYGSFQNDFRKYCREICFFEKKKVKELRKYINESILEETLTCEDRIQAEIILFKLIDLDLISFKVATILLPGYKKYFKMNKFRKHFKSINSLTRA